MSTVLPLLGSLWWFIPFINKLYNSKEKFKKKEYSTSNKKSIVKNTNIEGKI